MLNYVIKLQQLFVILLKVAIFSLQLSIEHRMLI